MTQFDVRVDGQRWTLERVPGAEMVNLVIQDVRTRQRQVYSMTAALAHGLGTALFREALVAQATSQLKREAAVSVVPSSNELQ